MKFISTKGEAPALTASEAIRQGLAEDGGLYIPEKWPKVKMPASNLEFHQFAFEVLSPFFENDPLAKDLQQICQQSFNFPISIRKIDDTFSILELFHGPTCAFKDFGARFLALCTEKIDDARKNDRIVLVATSGDTGGAVAAAFQSLTKIPVVVLYPKGRISQRQEKQLTVWGNQVRAVAVEGTFDDCQKLVKEAFLSPTWQKKYQMISANSINLARLLPQMAYFAYVSLKLRDSNLIIPSGNVGNATAALWAQHLGFPIRRVVLSHNSNATVPDYFKDGTWQPRNSLATLANAMDVGNPSNFERIRSLYPDLPDLQKKAQAISVSDDEIKQTILISAKNGLLVCPHTATALYIREKWGLDKSVVVATAHPAKFETIIEPLIGQTLKVPQVLETLLNKSSVSITIPPRLSSLETALS